MAILKTGFHDYSTGSSSLPKLGDWQAQGKTTEGLDIYTDASNGRKIVFDPSTGGIRDYGLYERFGVGDIAKDINPMATNADGSFMYSPQNMTTEGAQQAFAAKQAQANQALSSGAQSGAIGAGNDLAQAMARQPQTPQPRIPQQSGGLLSSPFRGGLSGGYRGVGGTGQSMGGGSGGMGFLGRFPMNNFFSRYWGK